MRNIKLILKFDGAAYHGWQIQPNADTVQQRITDAVTKIINEKPNIIGCSRTDAHVHANEYVCSFKTSSHISAEKLPCAINSYLPQDIVCIGAEEAAEDFHPIASAKCKRYVYKIQNSRYADPFNRSRVWHYRGKLDFDKMCKACKHFLGTHDFAGFAASGFSAKTTVRTIFDIELKSDGDMIVLDICGDGFLYNMVRIITGTIVWVGMGKINDADIPDIIESCNRSRAGITAPPEGLYLWRVEY